MLCALHWHAIYPGRRQRKASRRAMATMIMSYLVMNRAAWGRRKQAPYIRPWGRPLAPAGPASLRCTRAHPRDVRGRRRKGGWKRGHGKSTRGREKRGSVACLVRGYIRRGGPWIITEEGLPQGDDDASVCVIAIGVLFFCHYRHRSSHMRTEHLYVSWAKSPPSAQAVILRTQRYPYPLPFHPLRSSITGHGDGRESLPTPTPRQCRSGGGQGLAPIPDDVVNNKIRSASV